MKPVITIGRQSYILTLFLPQHIAKQHKADKKRTFKLENTHAAANQKESLDMALTLFNLSSAENMPTDDQHIAELTEALSSAKNELILRAKENQEQKDRQYDLLEQLPIGVIQLNEDDTITHQNAAAIHIIGHNWIGQAWLECYPQLKTTTTENHTRFLSSNQEIRQLDIKTHLRPNKSGKIIFIQDVTHQNQPQNQSKTQEKLTAMGKKIASLAHQLRTPLSSAMLYVEHLATPNLTPTNRVRFTQKTQEQLQRLERTVHSILRFIQGETIKNELVSINSLLFDAAQTLHAQILKKNLQIDIKILIPDRQLYANSQALMSALISLLENAAYASPPESIITLHAEATHTQCKIHVDNTGEAIDPTLDKQIYTPFFTTRPQGTGLGLSIAKQVAEEMGGHLGHTRTPDHKTRFTLTLPCPTQP